MSVHDSRNWKAVEATDLAGGNRELTVTGEVQVGASNEGPVLSPAEPQGINPVMLVLTLTTASDGPGADVLTWQAARYAMRIFQDQYHEVDISGQAVVKVEKLIS